MLDKLEEFDITCGDNIKMCMPDFIEKIEVLKLNL